MTNRSSLKRIEEGESAAFSVPHTRLLEVRRFTFVTMNAVVNNLTKGFEHARVSSVATTHNGLHFITTGGTASTTKPTNYQLLYRNAENFDGVWISKCSLLIKKDGDTNMHAFCKTPSSLPARTCRSSKVFFRCD